jgi:hypothetical protein
MSTIAIESPYVTIDEDGDLNIEFVSRDARISITVSQSADSFAVAHSAWYYVTKPDDIGIGRLNDGSFPIELVKKFFAKRTIES